MFLSDGSLKRPVAMLCLIIALTLLGLNSYRKIGLELMPKTDVPYITVTTIYPGASSTDIETDVAKKIEDEVMTIEGLKHVTSICMENVAVTLLEFNMDVNVDVAATDVREKIDLILSDFPSDVEKPVIQKLDINATPILNLALTGEMPLEDIYDYADNNLRNILGTITGVANVELIGGAPKEVHILLDKTLLEEANLTSLSVVNTIRNALGSIPSGRITEGKSEFSVKFNADYSTLEDIGNIRVSGRNNTYLFLKDIAKIYMGTEELRQKAYINGKPAIALKVVKKADANTVSVVDSINSQMDEINQNLPGGMKLIWFSDQADFVRQSVNNTIRNIFSGILLTAAILFLFLFNPRSTLIIAVTMPLTVIISLFFVYMLGFSMNVVTLLAAGLSTGVLVTNSIVVIENILSHLKKTGNSEEAARKGTGEVAVAVMASAGTNIMVLFPIAMMGGIVGMIFTPFAVTLLIVNVISLFISFTLTPILAKFLLKKENTKTKLHEMEEKVDKTLNKVISVFMSWIKPYLKTKSGCLKILLSALIIFIFSIFMLSKSGSDFMTEMDMGEVMVTMEFPATQNLETTIERTREIENIVKGMDGVTNILATIGKIDGMLGQSSEGVYISQLLIKLVPLKDRNFKVYEILEPMRNKLSQVTDCIVGVTIPSVMGGQMVPVEIDIIGPELEELDIIGEKLKAIATAMPEFKDPDISSKAGKTEIQLTPVRTIIDDIGLPASSVGLIMRANLEGIVASTFKSGDRSYDIRVKMDNSHNAQSLRELTIPTQTGQSVLMENIADFEETVPPIKILRKNKNRIVRLYSNLGEGTSLGEAVPKLISEVEKQKILPPGYSLYVGGQNEMLEESVGEFAEAALLAIILTFLTLAAILESFIKPIYIMLTLPLSLIGIVLALVVTGTSINIFILLGAVMLIGIVVNNAVLIFERLHVLQMEGMSPGEAMIEAIHDEFRPVIMITLAAVFGMLPLALASGMGSELTSGIGITSVGGIIVSSLLTLIVIPAFFELFTKKEKNGKN